MAWLQNLADKAETLLIKFDQNAATVFNDPNVKVVESADYNISPAEETIEETVTNMENDIGKIKSIIDFDDNRQNLSEKSMVSDSEDLGISFNIIENKTTPPVSTITDVFPSKDLQSECSLISSKSGSLQNSFILLDDAVVKYEDKINKLLCENEDLNQQIINIRHLYSEIQNENSNLQDQLERMSQALLATQNEMEQYRSRAQRILQEKEKLINVKQSVTGVQSNDSIISTYNDELKRELQFQEKKNNELLQKLTKANNDLAGVRQNVIFVQKDNEISKQVLVDNLLCEKKIRLAAEEECRLKSKELQCRLQEIAQQNNIVSNKMQEIYQLEQQLQQKVNHPGNDEMEEQLQNLTQTLISKQSNLEMTTTERNALRLQLEKLEKDYHRLLVKNQRNNVKISSVISIDDGKSQIPQFLKLSPFDVGVTRKVKRAYSSLDSISVRTGIFLRRYPVARVFLFCYIIMLHIWVLIILFNYIPSTSH